jgi:hypothetical protein
MIKFIKITTVILVTMIVAPTTSLAADASVELNVNDDDVEARLDVLVNPGGAPVTVGGGFLYSDDNDDADIWLANVNIAIKDEVGTPGLNLGLGFKGVFGETDAEPDDFTTLALAFQFLAEFDFRESGANLPISITASLAWAPEILSFSDTEDYFEFYTAVYIHVNYWAAMFVGYRDIEIEYDDDIEAEHDAFYFGARLTF